MTPEYDSIDILTIELQCIQKQVDGCGEECSRCMLNAVLSVENMVSALNEGIEALKREKQFAETAS